jgi:hypothetical protein
MNKSSLVDLAYSLTLTRTGRWTFPRLVGLSYRSKRLKIQFERAIRFSKNARGFLDGIKMCAPALVIRPKGKFIRRSLAWACVCECEAGNDLCGEIMAIRSRRWLIRRTSASKTPFPAGAMAVWKRLFEICP